MIYSLSQKYSPIKFIYQIIINQIKMAFTCILSYGTKIYVTILFKQKHYRILIIFKYKCSEKVCDAILTKTEEDSMCNLSWKLL